MRRTALEATLVTILLVSFLPAPAANAIVTNPTFITEWGTTGTGDGQFQAPTGILVANGYTYVADSTNHRVAVFDEIGGFVTNWGSSGSAEGQFGSIAGLATDASGNIFVTDPSNNRIQRFTSGGQFIEAWGWGVDDGTAAFQVCVSGCQTGIAGTGNAQFDRPEDIVVNPVTDEVFVLDTFNNRVQRFSAEGSFLGKWGTNGTTEGQLDYAYGIDLDASGNVGVSEWGNNRVQWFSPTGTFQEMWGWGVDDGSAAYQICTSTCQAGSGGLGDGRFQRPYGLAVDADGHVWVADNFNHQVQVFEGDGTYITRWGTNGTAPGEFDYPYGVDVSSVGGVYVTDAGNNRVQVFGAPTALTIKAPPRVAAGSIARIKGKLKSDEPACVAKQKVRLLGGKRTLATKKTGADGSYLFRQRIRKTVKVQVVFDSLTACGSSVSPKRTIRV